MGKKSQTTDELEKEKKKELAEDEEYLRQVDKVGREFVAQWEGAKFKKEKKEKADAMSGVEGKGHFTYLDRLAVYCQKKLEEIDFPVGWEFHALATQGKPIRVYGRWKDTQEGVVILVRDTCNRVFYRAVRVTYDPRIDVKNMDILMEQAENTSDSAKGLLLSDKKDPLTGMKKTESGIILPK